MKILGFFHICAINHYYEIISEQLKLLVDSKLYDKSEAIFVGVLGEIEKVEALFKDYPKIKILSHSTDLKKYEFLTLKLLREKSRTETFYGYYFHTKGVSYPDNIGGDHWRDYMNYYLLTKWRDNVDKLNEGFDTCGVKYIDKGFPAHYSGNFFWFKSEYAKNLAALYRVNTKDRYAAEMWLCSNNPKAACLCDYFVDYHTKGNFEPEMAKALSIYANKTTPIKPRSPDVIHKATTIDLSPSILKEFYSANTRWSNILEPFDKTPEVIKIIEKLDRMEVITKEVVEDFIRCKRKNAQEVFETLGILFKNDSGYHK